jgi:phosphoesterase RecJ-like protein
MENTLTFDPSVAELFREQLSGATSVLIGSHLNPDGDALGSSLALSHYLWSQGIKNEVLNHHRPPHNLKFLPGVSKIRQEPIHEGHDLGIIVDLDAVHRLGNMAQYFESIPHLIVIDHHVPIESPGDLRIVDTKAAATALILCRLFDQLEATITPEMATCLLTGIVTDTGSFRFRNTSPESLVWAANLIQAGGDINRVCEEVFQRKPLSSVRLLGHMLDRMELDCDDKLAFGTISVHDFDYAQATDEDTEGFVNELLSIETVEIAALFREVRPLKVRVSLRSRADFDVAGVAQEVGGGGHRNAAGCSFDMTLEEAVEVLIPRLRACLESS